MVVTCPHGSNCKGSATTKNSTCYLAVESDQLPGFLRSKYDYDMMKFAYDQAEPRYEAYRREVCGARVFFVCYKTLIAVFN
ncbi:MAG: hypothetical protein V7641_383 [Blastocatellia bacterium]